MVGFVLGGGGGGGGGLGRGDEGWEMGMGRGGGYDGYMAPDFFSRHRRGSSEQQPTDIYV